MKITFEGKTIQEILDQVRSLIALELAGPPVVTPVPETTAPEATVPEAIAPVDKPVEKPVEKPKARTPKQLENDERLRAAAKAKLAAKKTAKAEMGAGIIQPVRPTPPPQEPFSDPADIVKLRQRTLEDLQTAYANGHHQEVLELLSRFGDGAKSFRELPPDAFVPIREAIDSGALA